MRPRVLALDLEGTLISNAVSQIPRPGLMRFLESVRDDFEQIVIYTTVPEPLFRRIARLLGDEGCVPSWFPSIGYVRWSGEKKDLSHLGAGLGDALLVDDHRPYIAPGQELWWIEVALFGSPYADTDDGLQSALASIKQRLIDLS